MTHSSSSVIYSTEVVVSMTTTFLVGGCAADRVGRGGGLEKVVQAAAICPFCQH